MRLAGVAAVALVVMLYSWKVDRLSRVTLARAGNLVFAALLVADWTAIRVGGAWLGAQRSFVWAVYILVEIYSVVMVGIFWTYTNDVVTEHESNRLYGVIGGILGGAAGGAFVDAFARRLGTINLLLVCAGLVVFSAVLATRCGAPDPASAAIDRPRRGTAASVAFRPPRRSRGADQPGTRPTWPRCTAASDGS